jgi:hypothetical protein
MQMKPPSGRVQAMANQSPGDTPAIDGDGDIIPETLATHSESSSSRRAFSQ